MLNLYPRRFKDEFAIEMHTVFRSSVVDAAEEGILSLVVVCARELLGLPLNILREFWHEIQREEENMQVTQFTPMKQGSWGDSFWAGLPHLLIAVFIGITGGVANTKLAATLGTVLAVLLIAGLLVTIYYTWRNKWPAGRK